MLARFQKPTHDKEKGLKHLLALMRWDLQICIFGIDMRTLCYSAV